MANIGTVYKSSYKKDGVDVPLIMLDIRTLTQRKKLTISVNKVKYPSGAVTGAIADGKSEYPDYHIWANFSNRGESIPSVIVGNIKDAVSDGGLKYKRAKLFDPFVSKENIYFTLFSVDDDAKLVNPNLLYNVVAQPYRKPTTQDSQYQQQANPTYDTANDTRETIPATQTQAIDVDEDEIPF
ncbi:MAG: hypothetical protein Q9M40_07155 [Sulfurimonas sp.]|nr:hypothetical protein [Sulfurimonas sp.]